MLMKPRRRGPGRPPICPEGLTQIRVRLTPDQLAKLDAVACELNGRGVEPRHSSHITHLLRGQRPL